MELLPEMALLGVPGAPPAIGAAEGGTANAATGNCTHADSSSVANLFTCEADAAEEEEEPPGLRALAPAAAMALLDCSFKAVLTNPLRRL